MASATSLGGRTCVQPFGENPPHLFESVFGGSPQVTTKASGRVNLIGEHTDYNGGFVLPMLIPQHTVAELSPRADQRVRAFSATTGNMIEYHLGDEQPHRHWGDYIKGLTSVLRQEGFTHPGFDLTLCSDVPLGSGLSSSASLELAVLRGLREAFDLPLNEIQLALLGQKAENEFVGARCGNMDQLAASIGEVGQAVYIDTQAIKCEPVSLPQAADWIVINSGVSHQISDRAAGRDYNTRRGECEEACKLLGISLLRELDLADLGKTEKLPSLLAQRVRHVVTENQRVHDAMKCLRQGDIAQLGRLFVQSHASQRDDYDVSAPEVDLLVELALQVPKVFGARLTGGGFGGSIIAAAEQGSGMQAAQHIAAEYRKQSGKTPTILLPQAE